MFHELLRGKFCERTCKRERRQTGSCDILWIIILLLLVFNGGLLGIDICTLIILAIVFGGMHMLCKGKKPGACHERPCH